MSPLCCVTGFDILIMSASCAISILHAASLKHFQKEIYEDPRVIITRRPCRAPLLLLLFAGFSGIPEGRRVSSR